MGLFSPPTVEAVRARRWTVFIVSILENMLFAAPLFGWASLQNMLLSFGCASQLCIEDCQYFDGEELKAKYLAAQDEAGLAAFRAAKGNEQDKLWNDALCSTKYFSNYSVDEWSSRVDEKEWVMGCSNQASSMNSYYTIGTSFLSGSTMVYGLIMDKYGTRLLRLSGMAAFAISCLLFVLVQSDPRSMAWLITPAVLLNGMGGILYIFTGFQLANFFPAGRSTVCALLIGSYNASAIVYPLLFLAFDNGILSFRGCMLFHFFLAVASFVEGWLDTPVEPIPEPGSENRPIDDEKDEEKKESASDEIPSFSSVLFSIPCALSLITMCITVLRLSYYIGSMTIWFENAAKISNVTDEQEIKSIVDENTSLFGFLQPLCILWSIPIGYVLDRKFAVSKENPKKLAEAATNRDDGIPLLSENDRKNEKEVETTDSSVTFKRVQQLRNTRDAYFITVACLLVFGYLILLQDNIDVQVVTFVLHTVIRTLIHSSAAGLYVQVFHMAHIGKLTGLGSIAGGTFSFIMIPFEKLVTNVLNGNPYLLNVGLLLASVAGGFLPIYLHFFAKKTERELREIEETNRQIAKNNN